MKVEKVITGPLSNNAYIVWDEKTKDAIIIDPAKGSVQILDFAKKHGLIICGIINTHYHFDHVFDSAKLKKITNAPLMMQGLDISFYQNDKISEKFTDEKIEKTEVNVQLKDGYILQFGNEKLSVIHTPGHTEGSVCLYSRDQAILFTGDTLFAGTYGRVDLPGSDIEKMRISLGRLANFPVLTKIYPGHGKETILEDELDWLKKFKKE